MDTLSYRTKSANKATVTKEWLVVDAKNEVLGRLSSKVAFLLRGKHKPDFTPHVDCGDYVIVINADKVRLTGKKITDKQYVSHSGYPGGQNLTSPKEILEKKPEALVEKAVKGMLPGNRLGSEMFRNLHVFAGEEHKFEAQKPRKINLKDIIA